MTNKRKGKRRLKTFMKVLNKSRLEKEEAMKKARLELEWLVFWHKFKKAQLRDKI